MVSFRLAGSSDFDAKEPDEVAACRPDGVVTASSLLTTFAHDLFMPPAAEPAAGGLDVSLLGLAATGVAAPAVLGVSGAAGVAGSAGIAAADAGCSLLPPASPVSSGSSASADHRCRCPPVAADTVGGASGGDAGAGAVAAGSRTGAAGAGTGAIPATSAAGRCGAGTLVGAAAGGMAAATGGMAATMPAAPGTAGGTAAKPNSMGTTHPVAASAGAGCASQGPLTKHADASSASRSVASSRGNRRDSKSDKTPPCPRHSSIIAAMC
mmetsp:Transcript_1977/g.5101  ORF Transcript_1977/g.5101 Transcript_1977/m.5101 type:complete len:267 (+) Transcript_1977:838-1638(+)